MAEKQEQSKPAMDPAVEKFISAAIERGLSEGVALGMKLFQKAPAPASAEPPVDRREKCGECGQLKVGCKGEHTKMVVLPRNLRFAKAFQGAMINGITYLSTHSRHYITVPANAVNGINETIQRFESNEDEMLNGRVAVGRGVEQQGAIGWR